MFLGTTALREFWDPAQPMALLGEWCVREASDAAESRTILPCPWDDRARYYTTIAELEVVYERTLAALGGYLNAVHGVELPIRYWRIVLGPWVQHFVHVVADRTARLKMAEEHLPDFSTRILNRDGWITPGTTHEFVQRSTEDGYNLQLISELLVAQKKNPPSRAFPSVERQGSSRRQSWRRQLNELLEFIVSQGWQGVNYAYGGPAVGLYAMHCNAVDLVKFAAHLGPWAVPLTPPSSAIAALPRALTMDCRRSALAELALGNEAGIEHIAALLPQNFPALWLENFAAARQLAKRALSPRLRTIVSLVGWTFDEPFKLMAAEATLSGVRVVAGQHGGCYGVARYSSSEEHERRIADVYGTWGWASSTHPQDLNLPSQKLSLIANRGRGGKGEGDWVFVGNDHPRYLYRFQSSPVGGQWAQYFDAQLDFFRALSAATRSRFQYRRPPGADYGHRYYAQLRQAFPEVGIDGARKFQQRLLRCQLVVIDHNATTILEALAADVPTISFWQDCRWELRAEAVPYFEQLRAVGIWHPTAQAAAGQVMAVASDVAAWWQSRPVRDARTAFCNRFARASSDYAEQWKLVLSRELNSSGAEAIACV